MSTQGGGLTLDALMEVAKQFSGPVLHCIVIDTNVPADKVVRFEGTSFLRHAYEAATKHMRDKDFGLAMNPSAWVRVPQGTEPHSWFDGVEVWHLDSAPWIPWDIILADEAEAL